MKIHVHTHSAITIHEYNIEHEGINYIYREWIESDGKLLENSVETEEFRDEPVNADELCDKFSDYIENMPK